MLVPFLDDARETSCARTIVSLDPRQPLETAVEREPLSVREVVALALLETYGSDALVRVRDLDERGCARFTDAWRSFTAGRSPPPHRRRSLDDDRIGVVPASWPRTWEGRRRPPPWWPADGEPWTAGHSHLLRDAP